MKEFYQDADIGPTIDVKFKTTSQIAPNIRKVTGGWTLVLDNQLKQVWKHINYTMHTCIIYSMHGFAFGCVSMW